jgi:DNA repair protein RecO (recombination protein O)
MAAEKALALVLRTTDWSETSRIATLYTREYGKVRALAKGGRRLKSNFESALDLLTVCSIVLLRKTSGGLDLLTEARVEQRFTRLRKDLAALYAAYYVAELLADGTEDRDPHPALFDEALAALTEIGRDDGPTDPAARVLRFEMVWLREVGYSPTLDVCSACGVAVSERPQSFSSAAGGVVCASCSPAVRERRPLSAGGWRALQVLAAPGEDWRSIDDRRVRKELRQVLGQYVTYRMGRRPRLLPYLGS